MIDIKLNKEFYDKAKNINFAKYVLLQSASCFKDENLQK